MAYVAALLQIAAIRFLFGKTECMRAQKIYREASKTLTQPSAATKDDRAGSVNREWLPRGH